jgi:hypothetical protein
LCRGWKVLDAMTATPHRTAVSGHWGKCPMESFSNRS